MADQVVSTIKVKFEADGNEALQAAIRNLNKEVRRLKGGYTPLEKSTNSTNQKTRNLAGTFSVLRSKFLLASFGAGIVGATVGRLGATAIRTAGEFEALRTRLTQLFGSVDEGRRMFDLFNDVAATTPFQIQDIAEAGASLKAFGADAEALIKPIADLAAFMGTNAKDAAFAFGRAFSAGLSGAEILRERGIIELVKSFNGIEDLSEKTLPEFRQALINTLVDPASTISGATTLMSKTYVGAMSNMQDSISRAANALGEKLMPKALEMIGVATNLAKAVQGFLDPPTNAQKFRQQLISLGIELERFPNIIKQARMDDISKQMDDNSDAIERLLTKALELDGIGTRFDFLPFDAFGKEVKKISDIVDSAISSGDFEELRNQLGGLSLEFETLKDKSESGNITFEEMKRLGELTPIFTELEASITLAKGQLEVFNSISNETTQVTKTVNDSTKEQLTTFEQIIERFPELNESQKKYIQGLLDRKKLTDEQAEADKKLIEGFQKLAEDLGILKKENDDVVVTVDSLVKSFEDEAATILLTNQAIELLIQKNKEAAITLGFVKETITKDGLIKSIQDAKKEFDNLANVEQQVRAALEAIDKDLIKFAEDQGLLTKAVKETKNEVNDMATTYNISVISSIDDLKSLLKQQVANMLAQKALNAAIAAGNKEGAGSVAKAVGSVASGGFGSFLTALLSFGISSAMSGSFHSGGLIGGNRRAGNVPIMAQEGEFVMQRSAVESVGVEQLNSINKTGQVGGNITVNVTGNVMTQDFVDNQLSEAIADSVRRGINFG